jgi:hypothetical protein
MPDCSTTFGQLREPLEPPGNLRGLSVKKPAVFVFLLVPANTISRVFSSPLSIMFASYSPQSYRCPWASPSAPTYYCDPYDIYDLRRRRLEQAELAYRRAARRLAEEEAMRAYEAELARAEAQARAREQQQLEHAAAAAKAWGRFERRPTEVYGGKPQSHTIPIIYKSDRDDNNRHGGVDPKERENAAVVLQRRFRRRQADQAHLGELHALRSELERMQGAFVVPERYVLYTICSGLARVLTLMISRLEFDETGRLLYTSPNLGLRAYEESLTQLLTKLDAVESGGSDVVKKARKTIVADVEGQLAMLDDLKKRLWEEEQQRHLEVAEEKDSKMEDDWVPVETPPAEANADSDVSLEQPSVEPEKEEGAMEVEEIKEHSSTEIPMLVVSEA